MMIHLINYYLKNELLIFLFINYLGKKRKTKLQEAAGEGAWALGWDVHTRLRAPWRHDAPAMAAPGVGRRIALEAAG